MSTADNVPSVKTPRGITAVYLYEGRVLATASDFEPSKPAGFTLRRAQEWRASRQLAIEVVKALASPALYERLDGYDCEQIVKKMKGESHYINHGHEHE